MMKQKSTLITVCQLKILQYMREREREYEFMLLQNVKIREKYIP